jgi:hypothetical protein
MRKPIIFLWLVCIAPLAWAQERVEVITLSYRTAAEVIPIIQPLVGKDGAVTGMQNKLIIRATAARLAQIKEVIASLDTRPRSLMITVRQNTTREALENEASVYGTAGGAGGRVTLPDRGDDSQARVEVGGGRNRVGAKVTSTRDLEDSADVQHVQVLEGNSAFIRVGQSIPYHGRSVYRDVRGNAVVADSTTFRDVTSGFYVRPTVSGQQVTLEISPQRESPGQRGAVDVQSAATVLSGRLGEWIELGGVGQQSSSDDAGTTYSTRTTRRDTRSVFVKVEEIK